MQVLSRVLDRVIVPMNCDFKSAFFRALRAAIFKFNPHDLDKLKTALGIESDPKDWERSLAFKIDFKAQRVCQRIPDADLLYDRVKHAFDYYTMHYADKKDASIRCKLQI